MNQDLSLDEEAEKLRQIEDYRKNKLQFKNLYHYSNLLNAKPYSNEEEVEPQGNEANNKEELNHEVALLNARINALQEIIQIQSQEIQKSIESDSNTLYKHNLQASLLQKWREKVFELLVQIKSMDMASKEDNNKAHKKKKELMEQIKTLEYKLSISMQKENDLLARSKLLETKIKFLEITNKKLETLEKLRSKDKVDSRSIISSVLDQLTQFSGNFLKKQLDILQKQSSRTEIMQNRLTYATKRIGVIKAMLPTRKKEDAKPQQKQLIQQVSSSPVDLEVIQQQKQQIDMLKKEIENLTKDRDYLVQCNERHEEKLKEKVDEMVKKMKLEIDNAVSDARSAAEELFSCREEIETKTKECNILSDSLKRAQETLKEELEGIRNIKNQFLQIQRQSQLEREQAIRKIRHESEERYNTLYDEFNILKSEYAKKEAQLKRIERLLTREREEKDKNENEKFDHYEMKLAAKDTEIRTLKREIDALQASLKQYERMRSDTHVTFSEPEKTLQTVTANQQTISSSKQDTTTKTGQVSGLGPPPQTQAIPEREIMIKALDNLTALTNQYMKNSSATQDYLDNI